MGSEPMRLAEIWRYPVKSLQGERLEHAELGELGVEGDRAYAIWDLETDLGLTARRVPELLFASASLREDGSVRIETPAGEVSGDDDLSEWLGRRVELRSGPARGERLYENPTDFEREETEPWRSFSGSKLSFHDDEAVRVSLISTGTLREGGWDRRRFRANLVLDGSDELELAGTRAELGGAVLAIGKPIVRCVMVTRAQPGGLETDLEVMRTIARDHDRRLAIGATVPQPGALSVGDALLPLG